MAQATHFIAHLIFASFLAAALCEDPDVTENLTTQLPKSDGNDEEVAERGIWEQLSEKKNMLIGGVKLLSQMSVADSGHIMGEGIRSMGASAKDSIHEYAESVKEKIPRVPLMMEVGQSAADILTEALSGGVGVAADITGVSVKGAGSLVDTIQKIAGGQQR